MRIIILHKSKVSSFPPIIALIKTLNKLNVEVVLICGNDDEFFLKEIEEFCTKIHVVNINIAKNKIQKIKSWFDTRRYFWKVIYKNGYQDDLFWLPTADTTLALGNKLLSHNYILNLFELFDKYPFYRKNLAKYTTKAKLIICPEETRAHIFKVWWNLERLPFVLPNKPFDNVRGRNLKMPDDLLDKINSLKSKGKKIAIYQGILSEDRGLEGLCSVFNENKNFSLILMGRETDLIKKILKQYSNILYMPFVNPPYHLHITSHADLGILSYDYSSLNNIFCAPNKIWEFSGIGIPMLGNNIPGLINVIERCSLGQCVDFNDFLQVNKALEEVLVNYEKYSANSYNYYDSIDLVDLTKDVLKQVNNGNRA